MLKDKGGEGSPWKVKTCRMEEEAGQLAERREGQGSRAERTGVRRQEDGSARRGILI